MIVLDYNSATPIYRQIAEQLMRDIKTGALRPGERLPTERELAASLQIARGTVKRAYRELSDNNIIEVIQGSGSYVYNEREPADLERRRQAAELIEKDYDTLASFGMSHQEIKTLLHITLAKKAPPEAYARVAAVDCNPESLAMFKRQLNYIPGIVVSVFLVDAVLMDDAPDELLHEYDLVLTTSTHYPALAKALSDGSKLLAASVSPSRSTIVSICTLEPGRSMGIVCRSNKFANLVAEQIEQFASHRKNIPVCFETDLKTVRRFMKRFSAVVVAPDCAFLDPAVSGALLDEYAAAGGILIPFDYPIDRGSLIHIEERIDDVIRSRWSL
ncbi:MAG TPA: GntR family transcriptional regulator [Clostridia bacterium]|nr:GntR family transcriptional regulator [Clostridia bacterium]